MKKKKILWSAVLLAVLLAAVALCAALPADPDTQEEAEAPVPSEQAEKQPEQSLQSGEQPEQSAQAAEDRLMSVYEEGMFAFTAGQFRERFADTLPEGYRFADAVTVNPAREQRMQIDILDSTGTPVDMEILLDVPEPELAFNQMALVIKEDGYEEDAAAMLQWYVSTFFEGFDAQEQEAICEEFLDMFCSRSEEYAVYAGELLAAMMCCETEESGQYYYVLISAQ